MSNRAIWVGAASAVGIALGLIVYRYAVLPLAWSSPLANVLPGLAVALVVVARTATRHVGRPGTLILLAPAVAGVALAMGVMRLVVPSLAQAPLTMRQLPGFSLALPGGKTVSEDHEYARGKLTLGSIGDVGGVVIAAWQPGDGSSLSAADLEALAQVFASGFGKMKGKATPTSVAGPDGKPVGSIQFDGDLWLTMVPCGARQIVITTMGPSGSEGLHRRIVRSLACMPDRDQEMAVRNVGSALVLDLPGWYATERTPTYVQITDGRAMLMLLSVPSNIENAELAQVLGPLLKSQGTVATFAAPRDGRVPFSMRVGNDTVIGWARIFHCSKISEAVIALADNDAVAQSVYARVGTARCQKPGEAAQVWPEPPKK